MSQRTLLLALCAFVVGAGVASAVAAALLVHARRRVATAEANVVAARTEATRAAAQLEALQTSRGDEEARLRGMFAQISTDALSANAEQFLTLAETRLQAANAAATVELDRRNDSVEQLLTPLRAQLEHYRTAVSEMEARRADALGALTEKVDGLATLSANLQHETARLVQALRAPQTRGRWGELQLRRVVELAGMVNRVDFVEQAQTEVEGSRLRPDLVVNLPGGGTIVVDSKVPLQAFLDANDATTEADRTLALARHASQLRKHVTDLGSKEYWKQFTTAPEFVVCFIPGEPLANAAFEQDPSLMEDALKLNVIPATPTNLVTLLKTVAHNWRYADVEAKAKTVIDLGVELYDRLAVVGGHVEGLRKALTKTVEQYNAMVGSMETRLVVTARALRDAEVVASSTPAVASPSSVDVLAKATNAPELDVAPDRA